MPNQIDLYEPRKLMELIKTNPPIYTYLTDTFFRNKKTFVTESFDVDIKKGNRALAPFVSPELDGKIMKRHGFYTKNLRGPRIAPERVLSVNDLRNRLAGEALYSDRTPADRYIAMLAEDLYELEGSVKRRIEWMITQLLCTGTIPIIGDGVKTSIDFDFTQKKTLSGGEMWNQATANIRKNIHDWKRQVQKDGLVNPDTLIIADDVTDPIINNKNLKELSDIKDYNIARVAPHDQPDGVSYVGTIASEGVDIYAYNEYYEDDTDLDADGNPKVKPLIPSGTVILLPKKADFTIYYGSVTFIPEDSVTPVTVEGERVPRSLVARRPDRHITILESHPLPVAKNSNSWLVAKVINNE